MIHHRVQTIRERIHELAPEKARLMEQSGEMEKVLAEYQEEMEQQALELALEARRANEGEHPEAVRMERERAYATGAEIAQAQILEEVEAIYSPETTE